MDMDSRLLDKLMKRLAVELMKAQSLRVKLLKFNEMISIAIEAGGQVQVEDYLPSYVLQEIRAEQE